MNLKEKYGDWSLVTGASDGIGKAFCKEIARSGMNVCLVARREQVLIQYSQELEKEFKIKTRVIPLDLSDSISVKILAEKTIDLDIGLIVAAAGFGTSGEFLKSDLASELAMIDVNCRSVIQLCHHFGPKLAQRKSGGIVLMSSLVAFQGVPGAAHYSATKAFIQTFTEGWYHELSQYGVDLIASAPGPVFSGFSSRADMKMTQAETPETVARKTLLALGRKMTVRPGFLSKFLEYLLKTLPRWGRVLAMKKVMAGMIGHQKSK